MTVYGKKSNKKPSKIGEKRRRERGSLINNQHVSNKLNISRIAYVTVCSSQENRNFDVYLPASLQSLLIFTIMTIEGSMK